MSVIGGGLFLVLAILTWQACLPPQKEEFPNEVQLDFRDTVFQRITDLQDRRDTAALYPWLRHPNPNYRYLAARAFASFPASEAIDSLARLLRDPLDEIRAIAAYALGQMGDSTALPALIQSFGQVRDTANTFPHTQRALLEAVGKLADAALVTQLSTARHYEPSDTAALEGLCLGLYRAGLRGVVAPEATRRMQHYLHDAAYPAGVRLIAANYLARMPVRLDSVGVSDLIRIFEQASDPNLRMALAVALGKTRREAALSSLLTAYGRARDYRVKVNILRALGEFPYDGYRAAVLEAIRDDNPQVAGRAAALLVEHAAPEDATLCWRFAKDSLPASVQLDLYRAANRHLPVYLVEYRDAINAELRQRFRQAASPYEKAAALTALAEFAWNFRFLAREAEAAEHPVVGTAAMEGLRLIAERPDYYRFFGAGSRQVSRELAYYFQQAIRAGDAGRVAIAAQALRSQKIDFRPLIDSLAPLERALDSLELPKHIETYNELAHTLAYLRGDEDFEPLRPAYNHPIDWSQLAGLPARPRVRLATAEGDITLELWPELAPGTVANFLALARGGFYQDKLFHRVAPNFVIQGGCPRGDGYGSLDHTIRSEFSPVYYDEAGLVGMASAGPDTEGTQFFITHSPAMHLDGRYTAFGKVVEGMDAVAAIQVGDALANIVIEPN